MTAAASLTRPAIRPLAGGRNLVAIASGKGGVGKTWFAITLAHALARAGDRVLLFDGDLGLANVDIQLGLTPERDLGSVIAGRASLAAAAIPVPDVGFDVIAGQSGSTSLAALPREQLRALSEDLAALGERYDRVILDLGAGIEETVRTLATRARLCLVVTTDEPTALTDAYAFIKLMTRDHTAADLRIVVNQVASPAAGERTYATLRKACEGFLKLSPPLAGVVRHDRRVGDSIRLQTSLLTRFPGSEAAADVEAVARRLFSPG
ncbi:MAG TPA: MinD/ParA family protein [Alphaproteobacteria bacterium]|nr:MinD/ParA family protein [Alphaproteobacteria bacterium]